MSQTALAATHASHLISQGIKPSVAYEHARLRYGVDVDEIEREIESRHSFSLEVVEDTIADYFTFDAAKRWINHGVIDGCSCEGDCIMEISSHPDEQALCPERGR